MGFSFSERKNFQVPNLSFQWKKQPQNFEHQNLHQKKVTSQETDHQNTENFAPSNFPPPPVSSFVGQQLLASWRPKFQSSGDCNVWKKFKDPNGKFGAKKFKDQNRRSMQTARPPPAFGKVVTDLSKEIKVCCWSTRKGTPSTFNVWSIFVVKMVWKLRSVAARRTLMLSVLASPKSKKHNPMGGVSSKQMKR